MTYEKAAIILNDYFVGTSIPSIRDMKEACLTAEAACKILSKKEEVWRQQFEKWYGVDGAFLEKDFDGNYIVGSVDSDWFVYKKACENCLG